MTSSRTAGAISSARWILARPSSSRAAARGIAPSAAPGRSTAAPIEPRARRSWWKSCRGWPSPAFSSSTTSRSFIATMARRSRRPCSRRASASSTISRPAATCSCATRTCSVSGSGWDSNTCSWESRRSTRRRSRASASVRPRTQIWRRSSSRGPWASLSPSTSSRIPAGTRSASTSSAAGAWRFRKIVNISVATPYPGTEIWHTEQRRLTSRDYRLFDIQHAVLPTKLPLPEFYAELVETQRVLQHKHLGLKTLKNVAGLATRLFLKGQTNFIRSLLKFDSVFNPKLQLADHARKVDYEIPLPPESTDASRREAPLHPRAGAQAPRAG